MIGVYSNMYYPTRWVPLRRRGLGWHRCNELYEEHECVASCGLIDSMLEVVLDVKGCNLNCKFCWCWKMRHLSKDIRKTPEEVVSDILCRIDRTVNDKFVRRSKFEFGVIRITGNEPTLQWDHLIKVMEILNDIERLTEICERRGIDCSSAEIAHECKVIVETNGIRLRELDLTPILDFEIEIDFDVSFKGVNPEQFEWLSDRPSKLFFGQIEGFVRLFDFLESKDNVKANPVLGINHAPNYCVWRKGRKYVMDVEIVDREGRKMDFYDYSKEFEEDVLSRGDLRYDEAPFREYFGINRDRARLVVAVIYEGKRYLHVLPSEIPELVGGGNAVPR